MAGATPGGSQGRRPTAPGKYKLAAERVKEMRRMISRVVEEGSTAELVPVLGTTVWSLKTRLWHNAAHLGALLEVWDEGERVIFRRGLRPSQDSDQARQARKRRYERHVLALALGAVGELPLRPGDNAYSVRRSLHNAARRLALKLQVWRVDDTIFFQRVLAGEPSSR
jgi:hypothetical protein